MCYSGSPAEHLLIEPEKSMERDSIVLHLDNASAHNSRLSAENIESATTKRVPHPPYSPDLAPRDFFLFDYLKEKLRRISFTTGDDLIFAIRQI
jgi:histone-lysine N-methyltransferase SETMAR